MTGENIPQDEPVKALAKRGRPPMDRQPRASEDYARADHHRSVDHDRSDRMEVDKEFLQMLREGSEYSTLPNPPEIPGYHIKWSSMFNQQTGYRRDITLGYEVVQVSEMPEFYEDIRAAGHEVGGEFDGVVRFKEMILMKIPLQKYNAIMYYYHHELPLEQEAQVKEQIYAKLSYGDKSLVRDLGDGFTDLGRKGVSRPTFV